VPRTQVRSNQLKDGDVKRVDLNTTTSGDAVITKVVAGNNVTIYSTGTDAGTGDVEVHVDTIDGGVLT